jgi:outer membrane protein OmpA-like peptidoglycan-associated protein
VIQARSYALLDNVARVLTAQPRITKLRIEGHTDDQGDAVYNKRLSQRRADAVRAYLIKKGVDAGRLDAVGFGEEQFKTSNATAAGRATNRRVEFVIVDLAK